MEIFLYRFFFLFFSISLPLSIPLLITLEQNNLCTLSMSRCNLSGDVTRSLIQSMQSLHCRIQNLALKGCTISLPEDTQQTTILVKMDVALHSLDISWSVLNQMMSCKINPFTQSLTELILGVDFGTYISTSGVEIIVQKIASHCPGLKTLKIGGNVPQYPTCMVTTNFYSHCMLSVSACT